MIACDGIHSTIRSQFNVDKPRYSGRIAYRGLLPLSAISANWPYPTYAVSWLAPDKHFLVFPISRNQTLNVVAFVTKPESELGALKESWTSSAPRVELEREYDGWEPTVGAVIREMEARPGKWRLNDRELLERWTYCDGKVVLAGDAAHAMLPHQGKFVFCSGMLTLEACFRHSFLFLSIADSPHLHRLRRRPRDRRCLHPRPCHP